MAMERRFGVQVGGLQFDLASFPDMPEEVRQYLDELGRQTEENGGAGIFKVQADVMPPAVNEWVRAKIMDLQKRTKAGDLDVVKVENMDREWFADHMDKLVISTLADVDRISAGRYRKDLEKTAAVLCWAWRTLIQKDKDWRALGCQQAEKLYYGAVIAALLRTAAMCRSAEKEAGHENT